MCSASVNVRSTTSLPSRARSSAARSARTAARSSSAAAASPRSRRRARRARGRPAARDTSAPAGVAPRAAGSAGTRLPRRPAGAHQADARAGQPCGRRTAPLTPTGVGVSGGVAPSTCHAVSRARMQAERFVDRLELVAVTHLQELRAQDVGEVAGDAGAQACRGARRPCGVSSRSTSRRLSSAPTPARAPSVGAVRRRAADSRLPDR